MRGALAAALLLALAPAAARAATPCEAQVSVEPARAYVGQQLVYRLRILRAAEVASVRFADDLTFPSFRVEWLPGQTLDPAIRGLGADHRLVVEERRAIFPVRAGTLAIPPARIECLLAQGSSEAPVPGATVEVIEAPEGVLVGRIAASAQLDRARIALGESATLVVRVRGEAGLWDVAPEPDPIAGVDVYARAPETTRIPAQRLVVERSHAFDLVPRRAGTHVAPSLRFAWLDPETGRTHVEETAPLALEVFEPAPSPAEAAAERPPGATESGGAPLGVAAIALGFALVLVGIGVAAWRRVRAPSPIRVASARLDDAEAAAARGDRAAERDALAAALREALALRRPETRALTPEELAARSSRAEREAALALAELDRARFASEPAGATRLDAARVRALVRALSANLGHHGGMSQAVGERDGAAVRLPPPFVYVVAVVAGLLLHFFATPLRLELPLALRVAGALALGAASVALLAGALGLFRKTGQNPTPWSATPEVIASGVYAWTRNPMYVGMAFGQAAIGVAAANGWILAAIPLVLAVVFATAVRHEEAYLESKFGEAYRAYKSRVRRWL